MAQINGSPTSRTIGTAYIGVAIACFLIWILLFRKSTVNATEDESRSCGMALPLSLTVTALLSGTALHALLLAEADIRHSRQAIVRQELRIASIEAVFSALEQADRLDANQGNDRELLGLSGISTRIRIREVDRARLPPPLYRQDAPLFGHMYRILCNVSKDKLSYDLQSFAVLDPSGTIRVLSWTICR